MQTKPVSDVERRVLISLGIRQEIIDLPINIPSWLEDYFDSEGNPLPPLPFMRICPQKESFFIKLKKFFFRVKNKVLHKNLK